jgi:hypothetical protein
LTSNPEIIANLNKLKHLAFLDINPAPLQHAAARTSASGYKGPKIDLLEQSLFKPLPTSLNGTFDSISLFYIFHCLAGSFPTKASQVAATLLPALAPGPDSTFYGATILGPKDTTVQHNIFGRFLLWIYNRKGIFGNYEDRADTLRAGLAPYFEVVEVEVVGVVALFVCRGPKSQHIS